MLRYLLICFLLTTTSSVLAESQFLLAFDLTQNGKTLERGHALVSKKQHVWRRGFKRSYLKLSCHQTDSGKLQKLYSTVDHFSGLRVTHQLVENNAVLTVFYNVVQPRLSAIRALANSECKNMSPLVITTTKTFRFAVKMDHNGTHTFGKGMIFKTRSLQLIKDTS